MKVHWAQRQRHTSEKLCKNRIERTTDKQTRDFLFLWEKVENYCPTSWESVPVWGNVKLSREFAIGGIQQQRTASEPELNIALGQTDTATRLVWSEDLIFWFWYRIWFSFCKRTFVQTTILNNLLKYHRLWSALLFIRSHFGCSEKLDYQLLHFVVRAKQRTRNIHITN